MLRPLSALMSAIETRPSNDRLLIALAATGILLSVASAIVGALGILPAPVVVVVVLGGSSLAARLALLLRTRRSSALSNPRVLDVVSLCALALSGLAALATLVVVLPHAGPGMFLADLVLHAWSLAILLAAAAPVRTLGWRAFTGVALAGFLASAGLSRAVGAPVVQALGLDNIAATSIWVPVTEELLKAVPVALIAVLALRDTAGRPSVIDLTLLGAFAGAGFTLLENAEFGRIIADWTGAGPLSLLFPTMQRTDDTALVANSAGHLVWTALLGMAIGFGLLYRRRLRHSWIAIPTAFVLVTVEHGMGNALVPVVFGGIGSVIALIAGTAFFVVFERRPLRGRSTYRDGILLKPGTVALRRAAMARLQLPRTTESNEVSR